MIVDVHGEQQVVIAYIPLMKMTRTMGDGDSMIGRGAAHAGISRLTHMPGTGAAGFSKNRLLKSFLTRDILEY